MFAFIKLMKFLDWNENKIDINLFKTHFVIRFFIFAGIVISNDPGKYKKSFVS